MESLKERIEQKLNDNGAPVTESRITPKEVEHYIESWTYNLTDEDDVLEFKEAVEKGLERAIKDRNKYLTDSHLEFATEILEDMLKALKKVRG